MAFTTPTDGAAAGNIDGQSTTSQFPVLPAISHRDVADRSQPTVRGKYLFVGTQKLYVRGATYGAFRPDARKREYGDLAQIDRDFRQMSLAGFNAVRIPHTMPPRALMDIAQRHGLYVLVGLSAEQYAGFLADPAKAPDLGSIFRTTIRTVKGHPALLAYALGNEISASMARWLGPRTVERYLKRLYDIVKSEDSEALVTYVNYPSTEYLQLPFLDFVSFNVYLESEERLAAYLARLQNLVGDRPLLMSEVGLDSIRKGEEGQAHTLESQIRTTFAAGCCGAFVFSWTDEWYRGGAEVDDWAFGLTDRERKPKPALAAVQRAFAEVPFPAHLPWPRVSVVVCVYNGEETIADCCKGLTELVYPNFEVIVVDDGSTDGTAAIVDEYGFRLIRTVNRGLSNARNSGLEAATGELVAYTDGDARPDPHWLLHLAAAFMRSSHVGIGGWNLPPPGDGWIADCVANAPGGPMHVLVSDQEAEHIPGCSMAFRREALLAVGGFDPQFRTAGDDVDVCWRLQERGWTLGFEAGAMVWHHHRNSLRAYWKQQHGYGRAEALLERKWPNKYNVAGHLTWAGRLYGKGLTLPLGGVSRIYHGLWGMAPFQGLTDRGPGILGVLPLMPEWYLVIGGLFLLSVLSFSWRPLTVAIPLAVWALVAPLAQAVASARKSRFPDTALSLSRRWTMCATVALFHLLQPLARLRGRMRHGLTLWRRRTGHTLGLPFPHTFPLVVTRYRLPEHWLRDVEAKLIDLGGLVLHGGDYDRWDLEVRGGTFGGCRLLMAFEDTGSGTQLVRVRTWPRWPWGIVTTLVVCLALAGAAAADGAYVAAVVLAVLAALMGVGIVRDCGGTARVVRDALAACGLVTVEAGKRVFEHKQERM